MKALKDDDRCTLESAVGPAYRVIWLEGHQAKWQMAKLLFNNAHIRLAIKDAYEVHRRVIEWNAQFSEDRIPDQALGLDAMTVKSMRWAMTSWERMTFLNRWLAVTWLARLQMVLLPGVRCGAHFLFVARSKPNNLPGYLGGGRAVQRLWLGCASNNIQFQPQLTPVIFAEYVSKAIRFTTDQAARREAARLCCKLQSLVGEENLTHAFFAGRVGYGAAPSARSVRLPLAKLFGG